MTATERPEQGELKIGVLAVQGDFAEHIASLRKLGIEPQEVRLPHQMEDIDGLIIPGGESTTLSRLMSIYELRKPVAKLCLDGKCLWGTCAGMIMMAREITEEDPEPLGLMDIGVQRNSFGRQIDSFEQDLVESALGIEAKKELLPMQPGDVPDTYADVSSLVEDTGYQPSTDVETGVKAFVDWYRDFYKV